MEKKTIGLRGILFILAAVLGTASMFTNWFPVNLDLGYIQLNEVLGKINALTLSKMVKELEEMLGALAAFLPPEFAQLKKWSAVLMGCGVMTIALFVIGCVLVVTGKKAYRDAVAVSAGLGAIVTTAAFCTLISAVYEATGASAVKKDALSLVMDSPCKFVLACGVLSIFTMEPVAKFAASFVGTIADDPAAVGEKSVEAVRWMLCGACKLVALIIGKIVDNIVSLAEKCAGAVLGMIRFITEWAEILYSNIGYLLADLIGAGVGIFAGKIVADATGLVVLGVVLGMVAAGVTAGCCMMAVRYISKSNKQ